MARQALTRPLLKLNVFEANGAFANLHFSATSAGRIRSSWPTLVPLSGGRFLLAWTEVNVDNVAAGTNVMARIFSASQGPLGQVIQVNTLTGGQRFSLSAAATSGLRPSRRPSSHGLTTATQAPTIPAALFRDVR